MNRLTREQIIEKMHLTGKINLSHADLSHTDLSRIELKNVNLSHANLMQEDGLHPNEGAQPLMLEHVWRALRPLLGHKPDA